MKKMKIVVLIEKGNDGKFGIFTPDINATIIGEGASVAEAKSDFENSVREMLASYTDNGEQLPDELRDLEVEYKYDIASVFDYFKFINVSQFAKIAGINASLMRHYKLGDTYISEKQARRIEQAFHEIGRELLTVSL